QRVLSCGISSRSSGAKAGSRQPDPRDSTSSSHSTAARTGRRSRAFPTRSAGGSWSADPDNLTQEFYKADRRGRILVDTGRNEYSATHAAAYAVRPKPGAPVSAPCTWEEVESGAVQPRTFMLRGMAARLDQVGDLWGKLYDKPVALPEL